jgi:hypothetical protein
MKFMNLACKGLLISASLVVTSTAIAANPFLRPEVKIIEAPTYEEDTAQQVVNPYDSNLSLEVASDDMSSNKPYRNPLLDKESVVFKVSINGVDIYYDNATGQYIEDKGELKSIDLLTSSLPELQKVNF